MKKLATLATALTLLMPMAPAHAQSKDSYKRLWQAVRAAGVTIYINPPECYGATFDGNYRSAMRTMTICQDNGIAGSNQETDWTDNDLDTLRHEAHHVTQDCIYGGAANNRLGTIYIDTYGFARQFFDDTVIAKIVTNYRILGANEHVTVLEVEASAVAEMNDPNAQVLDLTKYCL
tara:strand:- start:3148 stop:3675 length:528 start_codon:yes stop_codon:yes gene_type:complete